MSDEVSIPISLPVDEDGFLRRGCPTCEREFKCMVSGDEEAATPAPDGGYFCPYCSVQAPPGSWWTKDQLELAQTRAYNQLVAPELEKLQREFKKLNRSTGFLQISAEITSDEPEEPVVSEVNDMRRVDFSCHPEDPVKVLDDWDRAVHCLICGTEAT